MNDIAVGILIHKILKFYVVCLNKANQYSNVEKLHPNKNRKHYSNKKNSI